MTSIIVSIEKCMAMTIAKNIKKNILKSPKRIKNKAYRLIMLEFFLLDYCKSETNNYLFYTDTEHKSLMCISQDPRPESNITSDYAYIECVVKGVNSKVTFSDYLDKAKTIKNNKVALGATPKLYDFYKSYGFILNNKYMEDWSCIGDNELKESYAMIFNNHLDGITDIN